MNPQLSSRLARELQLLGKATEGFSAWPKDGAINHLEAVITGPCGTPYEGGEFHLTIILPDRYPFEPPKMKFTTPIHHPNIDSEGRICLDLLNMPPKGAWKPSINLGVLLTSLRLLLSEPNPDDPLMAEIAQEYVQDRQLYLAKARQMTTQHALVQ